MANGDKPSGGFGGGGFSGLGQPGVRETKVVGETSEIKIPRKQFMEVWLFLFLLMILGYACLKLLIVSRGDWSLLVGILTIIGIPALAIFFERRIAFRYFPNVYNDVLEAIHRALSTDDLGRLILFLFFVSCGILVSVGFYIGILVPQITLILAEQAQFVFVFLAFFSLLLAFIPYYQFNRRQLTDSLRDSDSHYATRALELENERKIRREEAQKELMRVLPEPKEQMGYYTPVMYTASSKNPTRFAVDAQQRWKDAVLDFLEGVDKGNWGLSEKSWRNDPQTGAKWFPRSKYKLMDMGDVIRDQLIDKGYARWKNDKDHSAGWELLFTTSEIMEEAFNGGTTFRDAGTSASGDADDAGSD